MVGDKLINQSPFVQGDNSSYGSPPSQATLEAFHSGQAQSKFIRDISTANQKNNYQAQLQNSKELVGEHRDNINDPLRISLKKRKKPLILVEQGIRSGTKERLDISHSGSKSKLMLLFRQYN